MLSGRSIKLGTIYGIRIGVDPSWFIVLFLAIWWLSDLFASVYPGQDALAFALAVLSAFLFFGSLLLHELGHAVVAVRNGIAIAGIDLWLLGGVAQLSRDSDSAGVEFRVAVAGPLVSLALAVLSGVGAIATGAVTSVGETLASRPAAGTAVLALMAMVNAMLLLFNLIPGFPLDGGRIVRSIAWKLTGDRARATRFAGTLGRLVGLVFIGLAAGIAITALGSGDTGLLLNGLWLGLIGFFLERAARSSIAQADLTAQIQGLTVEDVMDAQPVAVALGTPLERVLDEYLLRYRWPWFPVVDADGRLAGLVTLEAVEAVPEDERATRTVDQVMAADPDGSMRAAVDESIEALIARRRGALQRLGAVMAVDAEGVLRGVITLQQVRRALRPG